ncbi:histidinol-phosphate transaminase [Paludisphaera soli]|uniref:histidinol-phosphate transaminase n=1 Tax=Paludisphaera soli TaxID=2712865 RepID=UPI0013ED91F1
MEGYVPGEQPQGGSFIKLNTNENPYPPSPRAKQALIDAVNDRLRLYPDPTGLAFRRTAAALHGVEPDMILAGNGSDDVLTILTRTFVGPGDLAAYPTPSYLLYSTLAALQDGRTHLVPFTEDWRLDLDGFLKPGVKLVYLANPNSPSGTAIPPSEVAALASRLDCPLVVDEAYGDFARENCIGLLKEHRNVIVTRSFSKGYSLAGLRLGYLIADAAIVAELKKVKDSYNCDALSLAAGQAALEDQAYLDETRSKILSTRDRLTSSLRAMGRDVTDSQANFVWTTGGPPAESTFQELKRRSVFVRLMRYPGYPAGLRISVGTDAEIDRLLQVLADLP